MFEIKGTGVYLPKNEITNQSFYDKWGNDPLEKIYNRLGHGVRFYCNENEDSASLAIEAGKDAITDAGLNPSDIDLIILSTDTPSQLSPATSSEVQHKLEAKNAGCFDINCACAGFATAFDIASRYIDDGNYNNILIVGTYAMSKFLDPEDKWATPLFGDGAGACIMSYTGKDNSYASKLTADGSYWDFMGIYGGGSKEPTTMETLDAKRNTVKILKKFPSSLNTEKWPPLIEQTLQKVNLTPKEVDMFIFTQIRKCTIEEVMDIFQMPMEKTHTIMEKWGYTGSGCVPMALHDAKVGNKLKKGDRVVICASGGGYSMACNTFIY